MEEARRFARRLLRLAMRVGSLRRSPTPSREVGPSALWACWVWGPLGSDFRSRVGVDQRAKR
eukprot:3828454-Alexandrium_andersonii.AAC.1